ncbi:hypothetical protein QL285_007867 [Trifolium repens]|nr:hypothetical protein QL285_007867 [Trifolium repens]
MHAGNSVTTLKEEWAKPEPPLWIGGDREWECCVGSGVCLLGLLRHIDCSFLVLVSKCSRQVHWLLRFN